MTDAAFAWSKVKERAAVLVAEDELSDERIAEECGVHRRTLARWKEHAEFRDRVGEHVEETRRAMARLAIAKRHKRVAVLDQLHEGLLRVVAERAAAHAEDAEQRATEDAGTRFLRSFIGDDGSPAGGGTGLLVKQFKMVGSGPGAKIVAEYGIDTGLIKSIQALEEQAAKELGQWEEKVAHAGEITVRRYIGVDVEAV